jgi:alanine dehydrogenase
VLVLSRREVVELIDVDALIAALADAMVDLSAGRASVPSLFPRKPVPSCPPIRR